MEKQELTALIEERSRDKRLSCPEARRIAEEVDVPGKTVGDICDELEIKLYACELGCF